MRALVFRGVGSVALEERPVPAVAAPDDVLVRVVGSGICGTDRKILLGAFPARPGVVLGHESVGVVESAGDAVRGVAPGDRVVVDPTLHCTACDRCRRGATNFCRNKRGTEVGVDRDGTFADLVVLPERFVHRLAPGVPFRRAVLVEPLACVLNNVRAGHVGVDDVVAVLGAGPIGMLVAVVADRLARRVVVVERDPYRLAAARAWSARVVDGDAADWRDALVEAAGGERPSVVVDTTGSGLEAAVDVVADGGRVVVMGFDGRYRASLSPLHLTNHGISIVGAGDYPADVFPVAADLAAGMDLDGLVTHELPLERWAEAFGNLAATGDGGYAAMKVVIRSDPSPPGADGWP